MNLDFLVLLLALTVLYKIQLVRPATVLDAQNLSPDRTNVIKGILAVMIVYYHLSQHLVDPVSSSSLYHKTTTNGYLYVCFFFFCSGFGLMKKHMADPLYSASFLRRRLPPILLSYLLISVIYWLAYCMVGKVFSFREIMIKTFVYGDPLVVYSWYIGSIVLFYIGFWLLMRVFRQRHYLVALGSFGLYLFYLYLCRKLAYPGYWYDSCMPFSLGVLWAYGEPAINRIIEKHYPLITGISVTAFSLLFAYRNVLNLYLWGSLLQPLFFGLLCCLFVLCLNLLTGKIRIGNPILRFLGKISLELYLFHGLYISVFGSWFMQIENELIRCTLATAASITTAALYKKGFDFIRLKHFIQRKT